MKPYGLFSISYSLSTLMLVISNLSINLNAQGIESSPDYFSNFDQLKNPYIIEGFSPNFNLPYSLSAYDQGKIVVDIFISKKGNIDGFNIKYVHIVNKKDTLEYYKYSMSHTKYEDYPTSIGNLYYPIKQIINKLKIIKSDPHLPKKKYIISMPLKIQKDSLAIIK